MWTLYFAAVVSIFLCFFFFSFSSPNLSGHRLDVYHRPTSTHGVALVQIYRYETCCTRLAGNAGRKNSPKMRHLRTIPQLCRAISSQLKHVSTIEKRIKQHYLLHMASQYGKLRPTKFVQRRSTTLCSMCGHLLGWHTL